jgi:hypothetical protein
MCCASTLIPLYLSNISVSSNLNIGGAPLRHFLLQNEGNMFLVSKCKLIILPTSSYQIRKVKNFLFIVLLVLILIHYLEIRYNL